MLTGRAGAAYSSENSARPSWLAGQEIEALVAHERGGAGDRVEAPLDLGPDALLGLAPTRPRCGGLCGAGEVEEVGALGVV